MRIGTGHARRSTLPALAALLALGLAPAGAGRALRDLRDDRPSRADVERMERGYYEHLLDSGRSLAEPDARPVAAANPFHEGELDRPVGDLREYVLKPNLHATHKGAPWSTNAFGLRDREYARYRPADTLRVLLLGDSIGVGWGVADEDDFESIAERTLAEESRAAGGPAVEVWNLSVPGHAPGQRWEDLVRLGWDVAPDLVVFQATPADLGWDERRLRALLPRGLGWDAPQYRDALSTAGVAPGGDAESYARALKPRRRAILENVYKAVAAGCHAHGVRTLWVLVPRVGRPASAEERTTLVDLARRAGFDATTDLSDAFDGAEPEALAIAPDDHHPNAEGHARLARRLLPALRTALRPGPSPARTVAEVRRR